MSNFKLTPSARNDLKQIAKYTVREWGEEQALTYKRKLDACFNQIGKGEIVQRTFTAKLPGLLVRRCEKHFIFYFKKEKEPAVILNILHERMDLMKRMRKRLKEYGR